MGTQASLGSPYPPLSCVPHPLTPHLLHPHPSSIGGPALSCLYLPITQPKETSTLYTCIKEIKCYF
uniref:Uncharacterized protein n=1 Tax=Castor canadensis TaxID=51338 RepID=A0A8C0XW48_CASCN